MHPVQTFHSENKTKQNKTSWWDWAHFFFPTKAAGPLIVISIWLWPNSTTFSPAAPAHERRKSWSGKRAYVLALPRLSLSLIFFLCIFPLGSGWGWESTLGTRTGEKVVHSWDISLAHHVFYRDSFMGHHVVWLEDINVSSYSKIRRQAESLCSERPKPTPCTGMHAPKPTIYFYPDFVSEQKRTDLALQPSCRWVTCLSDPPWNLHGRIFTPKTAPERCTVSSFSSWPHPPEVPKASGMLLAQSPPLLLVLRYLWSNAQGRSPSSTGCWSQASFFELPARLHNSETRRSPFNH